MRQRDIISFVLALMLIGLGARASSAAQTSALDGRIGGTVESFQALYGLPVPPEEGVPSVSDEYAVPGFSAVMADSWNGRIGNIMLFPPRPEGEEYVSGVPHDMDWSVMQAHEVALSFLPPDAAMSEVESRSIRMVGFSPTLAAEVAAEVYAYGDPSFEVGQVSYYIAMNADSSGVEWIIVGLRDDL